MSDASLTAGPWLRPLQGRWFASYRVAWWLLALTAVGTALWTLVDARAAIEIILIRTAKAMVLVTVSAILYRRRNRDGVAAMLALSFLFWTISSSVDFADQTALPAILDHIRFFFFALALLLFPDGRWVPDWTRIVGLAVAATLLVGMTEALDIVSTAMFLPLAIGCVLSAVAAMGMRYRLLDEGPQKQQLKWVILGLVIGIGLILSARAGAALTDQMLIPMVGSILLEVAFQAGIVIVALGFLTSLLRYRLYDAEAAISRSAVGAALTLALVGVFAASEVMMELLGQQLFGMSMGNISGAVAAAIAAMMLTPLHERISRWAEQHFQRDLAVLKHDLPNLLAAMSNGASLDRLTAAVLPRIGEAVQATRVALLVDGRLAGTVGVSRHNAKRMLRGWKPPEEPMLVNRSEDDEFPLQMALNCPLGNPRAWLLLGPRPDGTFYGGDDLDALSEIAPPLQRTVLAVADRQADARRRKRMDGKLRETLAGLERRIASLEAR